MKQHSTVEQFEKMALVLKNSIEKRGKTSIADIQEWIGCNYSKSKRFAFQLKEAGYLQSDNARPTQAGSHDQTLQGGGMNMIVFPLKKAEKLDRLCLCINCSKLFIDVVDSRDHGICSLSCGYAFRGISWSDFL